MSIFNNIPIVRVDKLTFSTYSLSEIRTLSVKEVTNPHTFDSLLHPTIGGLHDPVYGATDRNSVCGTCGENFVRCEGHFGHIELPLPVFNPMFFNTLVKILKSSCFSCHRIMAPFHKSCLLIYQLCLLDYGLIDEVDSLSRFVPIVAETHGLDTPKFQAEFEQTLSAYVTLRIKGLCKVDHVKNIVDIRQTLIAEFNRMEILPASRLAKCRHCKAGVTKIRVENKCQLIMHISSQQRDDVMKKYQDYIKKKKLAREREYDEDVDEVIMENEVTQEEDAKPKKHSAPQQTYLTPTEALTHFKSVWCNDAALLKSLYGTLVGADNPEDVFFLDIIPVSPIRFRPASIMKGIKYEHPHTANMAKVLRDCVIIRTVLGEVKRLVDGTPETYDSIKSSILSSLAGDKIEEKLSSAWAQLQTHVNGILDSELDTISSTKHAGIKQRLEKKEGLFRMHMMGKRVNYAARSVISPDPCIAANEIGIPEVFAKKLTYPDTVTPWNVDEMRRAVLNGPAVHPGASIVVSEDGRKTLISSTNKSQREALAKQLLTPSANRRANMYGCKMVYRHLKNGDLLLINRQPTLHRPSIQAHRARVLPAERTIRLHYANCKAYNADFDGDEMNAHFPQSHDARSEATNIMSTDWQYLTPKDGTPLAGLIQDHVVSGVALTIRGNFFTREDYQQLVYSAMFDHPAAVHCLPPCIVKPRPLWSGKQIVSTVLINTIAVTNTKHFISLEGKAKIPERSWVTDTPHPAGCGDIPLGMGESEVIIHQGELLCGVLDKAHYGATQYGLVHAVYELYGGNIAGTLLTRLARLFTSYLQQQAFTLSVRDVLLTRQADRKRQKILRRSIKEAAAAVPQWFRAGVEHEGGDKADIIDAYRALQFDADPNSLAELDLSVKSVTDSTQNNVTKWSLPLGLLSRFPHNSLQLMVQSGSKGSTVNTMQISCLLGQIELEGRRPPLMLSGKSLPSFEAYDTSMRAGGFIDGRFLTGIRPQEYFFHCMAGREGLVDTAVKTSRSGYLQRCLIKHLEGVIVNYDMTVRDSDGSVMQFLYGEDGLDVCKTPYMHRDQFPFLVTNHRAVWNKRTKKQLPSNFSKLGSNHLYDEIERWRSKNKWTGQKCYSSGFLHFCMKYGHNIGDGDMANVVSLKEDSRDGVSVKVEPESDMGGDDQMKGGETGRSRRTKTLEMAWRNLTPRKRQKYERCQSRCPDPPLTYLSPFHQTGVLPEKLASVLASFKLNNSREMRWDDFNHMMSLKYTRSLSEPGDAVGLLAAQSIGEPSTQMTLNTFHFAGRGEMNVTLGIPRLREIIMVAGNEIKTPSLEVPVLPGKAAYRRAKQLQTRLQRIHLSEVLQDVTATDYLSVQTGPSKTRECRRMYRIRMTFLPHAAYRQDFHITPRQILASVEAVYVKRLETLIKQKLRDIKKTRLLSTGSLKASKKQVEETEVVVADDVGGDGSDVEMDGDEDSSLTKAAARRNDTLEYEGEDSERDEVDEESEGEDVMSAEEDDSFNDTDVLNDPNVSSGGSNRRANAEVKDNARINRVLNMSSYIHSYTYDLDHNQWCEITMKFPIQNEPLDIASIIQSDAHKAVIQQTPGIKRCFLTEAKQKDGSLQHVLKTEGLNLPKIHLYGETLDLNRLHCNDIQVMARVYGIEAASRVLIQEIQKVFSVYGITVDYRHLSLVADYMTFEGQYKPCNRNAITSNASPLQKITFETSMNFIKLASLHENTDKLDSPSARIVTGQVLKGGTGLFDVIHPLIL